MSLKSSKVTGGAARFIQLNDVPDTYTGHARKFLAVNADETAVEFQTILNAVGGVTDSAEIDLTLNATILTASIIPGSIDESKLDVSVNTSLDLADSSVQPSTGSTDNAIVRYSGTSGKVIKLSTVTVDDGGNLNVPGTINGRNTSLDSAKLDGIAPGATFNSSDATLINRTNHTGTQSASTISNFDSAVAATPSVTANTAKVTNANHTGDVTGSGVLTLQAEAISNKPLATPTGADTFLFLDVTDGLLKQNNISTLPSNGSGLVSTFETVNKNLSTYPAALNYNGSGDITSVVYTVPGGTITKTLNYTSGDLTSIVLSGNTPAGINLTKTLNYTAGNLTGVSYS